MAANARFRSFVADKAKQCLLSHDYGEAFSHFLLAIKIMPDRINEIEGDFVFCLRQLTDQLNDMDQDGKLDVVFAQAKAVCCVSDRLMCALAEQALRLERLHLAVHLTQEAKQLFSDSLVAMETWERVAYYVVERWHFKMLNDKQRNQAYRDAIVSTIEKNGVSSVLDIGCGTGLLSLCAVEGGAKRVMMCDASSVMADVCSSVVASHRHLTHSNSKSPCQLHVFEARSTSLGVPRHLPHKVDLVVTEIFDAALFGEHCLSTLRHAWSHLLDNEADRTGKVIPGSARLYVCAIECPEIRKENCLRPDSLPLLDLGGVRVLSRTGVAGDEPYTTEDLHTLRHSYRFLSPLHTLMEVDFNDPQALEKLHSHSSVMTIDIYSEGTVDALALWFDLDLCEGIKVSTAPSSECCWEQAIFPIMSGQTSDDAGGSTDFAQSPRVNCGDQLKVRCALLDDCLRLRLDQVVPFGYFLTSCNLSAHSPSEYESCESIAMGTGECGPQSSEYENSGLAEGAEDRKCKCERMGDLDPRCPCQERGRLNPLRDAEEMGMTVKNKHRAMANMCVAGGQCLSCAQKRSVGMKCCEEVKGWTALDRNGEKCAVSCSEVGGGTDRLQCHCRGSRASEEPQMSSLLQKNGGLQQENELADVRTKTLSLSLGRAEESLSNDCHFQANQKHSDNDCSPANFLVHCNGHGKSLPKLVGERVQETGSSVCSEGVACKNGKGQQEKNNHSDNNEGPALGNSCNEPSLSLTEGDESGSCRRHEKDTSESSTSDCAISPVHQDGFTANESTPINGRNIPAEEGTSEIPSCSHIDRNLNTNCDTSCRAGKSLNAHSSTLYHTTIIKSMATNSDHSFMRANGSFNLTPSTTSETFHLHRSEVRQLNDGKYNSLYSCALQQIRACAKSTEKIIAISASPPVHGLLALKLGFQAGDFLYVGPSSQEEMERLTEEVWRRNAVAGGQWKWCGGSVEETVDRWKEEDIGVELTLVDVVETIGALQTGLPAQLAALGRVMKDDTVVVPRSVDVFATVIESKPLWNMSCVTSDDNTLGFSIAPHINPFKTRTFLDLDIHALPHENLTDVFHVFRLDIQASLTSHDPAGSPHGAQVTTPASGPLRHGNTTGAMFSQHKEISLTARRSGQATAVLFWFDLALTPNVRASTLDPDMNWRQAAYVLSEEEVKEGEKVTVEATLKNTYLHFVLKAGEDKGSS